MAEERQYTQVLTIKKIKSIYVFPTKKKVILLSFTKKQKGSERKINSVIRKKVGSNQFEFNFPFFPFFSGLWYFLHHHLQEEVKYLLTLFFSPCLFFREFWIFYKLSSRAVAMEIYGNIIHQKMLSFLYNTTFYKPFFRTKTSQFCITFRGPRIWNSYWIYHSIPSKTKPNIFA